MCRRGVGRAAPSKAAGSAAFTGDGVKDEVYRGTIEAIKAIGRGRRTFQALAAHTSPVRDDADDRDDRDSR